MGKGRGCRPGRTLGLWLAATLLVGGCTLVGGPARPAPAPSPVPSLGREPPPAATPAPTLSPAPDAPATGLAPGWTETGVASWYGDPYHGRPTSSGEIYDQEALTGAHRTLPFGTRLRVENLDNGRFTELTVNDRGPFTEVRILDVSRRCARELELLGPGTARVRLTVLEAPPASGRQCWMVQIGAFAEEENARGLQDRLGSEGVPARVSPSLDGLYRVYAGPLQSLEDARRVQERHGGLLVGC